MDHKKVLFINSYQRSGSTLLGMLLDYHRAIIYLGEVRNVHEYLECNKTDFNGDLLTECGFWKTVCDNLPDNPLRLFTKVSSSSHLRGFCPKISRILISPLFDELTSKFFPVLRPDIHAYENIRKYYMAASASTDAQWLVDSSHQTPEARDHARIMGADIKVVFLSRDGRGVVSSIMKRTGDSAKSATKNWKRFILRAQKFHSTLPSSQFLKVKYEDLCGKLPEELDKIAVFLGVENFINQLDRNGMIHHFVGGSSTLRYNNNKTLNIRLDEKWRGSMSQKDLVTFERIAGKLNRSLGYLR